MKPSSIPEILDLAFKARENGLTFVPCFAGDAGLGKSEIVQGWAKAKDKEFEADGGFKMIDLRIALLEAPDLIGIFHEYTDKDGRPRQGNSLPHFWPTEGRGILFLDEVNRGQPAVTNALMQLLTDRKVGPNYKLPDGYIIVSAINKAGASYEVVEMDTALADRFEEISIDYDYTTFMNYVEDANWHQKLTSYLRSGTWVYRKPDHIGKDGKYISPRTWSKVNSIEQSGAGSNQRIHSDLIISILGKAIGNEYLKVYWDEAPVTAQDLLKDKKKAIKELKKQSKSGDTYAGDRITMTIDSIIAAYGGWFKGCDFDQDDSKIDEQTMVDVAVVIPADMAINMIRSCGLNVVNGVISDFFKGFQKRNPNCIGIIKDNIKLDRTKKA